MRKITRSGLSILPGVCAEAIPEDADDVGARNLLSVHRAASLAAVEALLNAVVAGHVSTSQHHIIFIRAASNAEHLALPILKLQAHVVLVSRSLSQFCPRRCPQLP